MRRLALCAEYHLFLLRQVQPEIGRLVAFLLRLFQHRHRDSLYGMPVEHQCRQAEKLASRAVGASSRVVFYHALVRQQIQQPVHG